MVNRQEGQCGHFNNIDGAGVDHTLGALADHSVQAALVWQLMIISETAIDGSRSSAASVAHSWATSIE